MNPLGYTEFSGQSLGLQNMAPLGACGVALSFGVYSFVKFTWLRNLGICNERSEC